ncbi:MAG: U32 family peptidase [Acidobacteria bacterium]|nr:U32 family peptidase [Acidobacteriota bacterium]
MTILSPVSSADEVEMLVESGAGELYCGLVPPEWIRAYSGAVWLNRRSPAGANLSRLDDLALLVSRAHARGVPVFLTLNAPVYIESQLTYLADLARQAVGECGIDGLIVSDTALLLTLADTGLGPRLHVSSVASALNSEAVRFYRDLGVGRVILPRGLSVEEVGRISAAVGGAVPLEAFVLYDGCAFEEGLCHTLHHHRVGAFCVDLARWDPTFERTDGAAPGPGEAARLEAHFARHREWIWHLNACGATVSSGGMPLGACGVCAMPAFRRFGVHAVKIAGRQASPLRKLLGLRLVRAVLARMETGASDEDVVQWAVRARGMPETCASGVMCYYRGPFTARRENAGV